MDFLQRWGTWALATSITLPVVHAGEMDSFPAEARDIATAPSIALPERAGERGDAGEAAMLEARQEHLPRHRALEIDPALGEAYASLGLLWRHQGAAVEAEEHFPRAIELSPDCANACTWYANLLAGQKGRTEDSLEVLERGSELDPASPIIRENLARSLLLSGRPDEARSVALVGLERNPDSAGLHSVMVDIFRWSKHQFDEALRWAQAAARLTPLNPARRQTECELLLQLGMDAEAELCLDAWQASFPDLPSSATGMSRRDLYLIREEPGQAVAYAEQLAGAADDEGTRWLLGETYVLNGELLKARPIYEELRPELFAEGDVAVPEYKVGSAIVVGEILYASGEPVAADRLFDRTLATLSTMDRSLYGYIDAGIHMTRGDRKAAILALRSAYEAGVINHWWVLKAPVYDAMRVEPEWNELVAQVLGEIERQREHYRQTKDDPVL